MTRPRISLSRHARRAARRGATFAEQFVLLGAVALLGGAGFSRLGGAMHAAIDEGATARASATSASDSVDASEPAEGTHGGGVLPAVQAGLVNLARAAADVASHADEVAELGRTARVPLLERLRSLLDVQEMVIRRVTRTEDARPSLFVSERRFMPAQVRKLREAAHRLWVEDLTSGAIPSGLTRDEAGRAAVRLGSLEVPVGPVPMFRDPESFRLLKAEDQLRELFADRHDAQLQGMLARLDDAYDYAFSQGLTAAEASGRTHFLGPDYARFADNVNNAFAPPGGWLVVVHGKPDGFMRPTLTGGWEDVPVEEMIRTLEADGYRRGQPILLASCSAGACFRTPDIAAQQLAEAAGAPVVAASNTVLGPPSGALFIHGRWEGTLGEWRLFQPNKEWRFPLRKRVVVGRDAHEGELRLAATHDLWRVRAGTVERLEIAGEWERFMLDNQGALEAAWNALKPGGRLVLRVDHKDPKPFVEALRALRFSVRRSVAGDHVTVVAVRPLR